MIGLAGSIAASPGCNSEGLYIVVGVGVMLNEKYSWCKKIKMLSRLWFFKRCCMQLGIIKVLLYKTKFVISIGALQ